MDVILKIELTDERMVEIGLDFKELIEEIEAKDKLEFVDLIWCSMTYI